MVFDTLSDGAPAELVDAAGALETEPLAEAGGGGLDDSDGDGETDVEDDGFGEDGLVDGFVVEVLGDGGFVVVGCDGERVAPPPVPFVPVGLSDGTVAGGVGSSEVP